MVVRVFHFLLGAAVLGPADHGSPIATADELDLVVVDVTVRSAPAARAVTLRVDGGVAASLDPSIPSIPLRWPGDRPTLELGRFGASARLEADNVLELLHRAQTIVGTSPTSFVAVWDFTDEGFGKIELELAPRPASAP